MSFAADLGPEVVSFRPEVRSPGDGEDDDVGLLLEQRVPTLARVAPLAHVHSPERKWKKRYLLERKLNISSRT